MKAWGRAGRLAVLVSALLAGCGGGGGNAASGSASCDLPSQLTWLRSYMLDWYFWSGRSPNPDPVGYTTLQSYFDALRFTDYGGTGATDPWSYFQDSVSYNRFFAEGQTLGYGIFVNGIERQLPLRVRMIEPRSPAAAAGVARGDTVVSVNGVAAADLVASGNFDALNPSQAGDTVTVVLDSGAGPRTLTLTAALFDLTPVPAHRVIDLPGGGKAGYVVLKDFITQAEAPLAAALADFRAQGATELIVDLRYNGGGRVSTARALASLIAGAAHEGKVFTELRYNAKQAANNTPYAFVAGPAPAFGRVVVLTGPRTCSASELVVNGLAPHVNVVTVGATTCGKPYGFSPVESCGNTFSAVNFQAVNSAGFGGYEAGLVPTCAAVDTFTGTPGDAAEALTASAVGYLGSGSCPPVSATSGASSTKAALALRGGTVREPGEQRGMRAD